MNKESKGEGLAMLKANVAEVERGFWLGPVLIVFGFTVSLNVPVVVASVVISILASLWWIQTVKNDPWNGQRHMVSLFVFPVVLFSVTGSLEVGHLEKAGRLVLFVGVNAVVLKLLVQSRKKDLLRRIAEAEKRIDPRGVLGMDSG